MTDRRPDRDAVRRWVEATCAQQGLPVKITDPEAIRNVAILLTPVGRADGRSYRSSGALTQRAGR